MAGLDARDDALRQNVDLTVLIKELSNPQLKDVAGAEEYRDKLLRNFRRVGELAASNIALLKQEVYPLLQADRLLTDEETRRLHRLNDLLLNAQMLENLDIPLRYRISQKLLQDAERKQDPALLVRALDDFIAASYMIMEMSDRLYPADDSFFKYRDAGLRAVERITEFLDKDRFLSLEEEEVREMVLINARYGISVFQHPFENIDRPFADEGFQLLTSALELAEDPFYREHAPGYDWRFHVFRTLQYFSSMTEHCNEIGLSKEQLALVNEYTGRLKELQHSDDAFFSQYTTEELLRLCEARNAYLTGALPKALYREKLLELSREPGRQDFSLFDNMTKVLSPLEYVLTLDPDNLSAEEAETVTDFYNNLISYIHLMPKFGAFTFLICDIVRILEHFIEVPGGVDFETMCLELMAAIHPPTYVHSLSVAHMTVCIAKHLFDEKPELFEGVPGYPDKEAVLDCAWHAAVCHDFGKLYVVETIITYGRNLYDHEFDWIKSHPEIGARLLARFEKTKPYVHVAMGHHKWYNNRGGYPASFDMEKAPDKTLVCVVACADCLDASTDEVGRSYKRGISLDRFLAELHEGSGTRYAPYLEDLLRKPEVYAEMDDLLNAGRDENYRKTYRILSRVKHDSV